MKKYLVSDSFPTAGVIIVGVGALIAMVILFLLK
jgi:hypothetical protein